MVPEAALTVAKLRNAVAPGQRENLLFHYVSLTAKVCANARRRVLEGETLANDEKIFSIFEPHTELIKRGKQPVPIQYGHNVLVIEDAMGFVVEHRVVNHGVLDQDLVVPVTGLLPVPMPSPAKDKRRVVNKKGREPWPFVKRDRIILGSSRRSAPCSPATA